jgi:xanthine dehydrogenase accessory factor
MAPPSTSRKTPVSGVLILGLTDVASAVAHQLVRDGWMVVMSQPTAPTAHRRGMAYTDAYWDGHAILEGIACVRLTASEDWLTHRSVRPLVLLTQTPPLPDPRLPILIDARMQKRTIPSDQRASAALLIGLGPGFQVGQNCHIAIETCWGDTLGHVITTGATQMLSGEPRPIEGYGRERILYAPENGLWESTYQIGDPVLAGDTVGHVGQQPLKAPLPGVLRGLTRPGLTVKAGTKLVEVDPRGKQSLVFGLGERPRHIAAGVSAALQGWH